MGRASVVIGVLCLALAACGDDGESAEPVSQEAYDAEVERLCAQHGAIIGRAYGDIVEDSDAEEAAYYTTDFIPRGRALIRALDDFGFPADQADEYRESLNESLAALADIEEQPYRYIDQRHNRELTPEEDLVNRFRAGLAGADVPC